MGELSQLWQGFFTSLLKLLIKLALILPKPVVGVLLRKMIPDDY